MLHRAFIATLNHLLAGEGWARERLRNFSGRQLRICGGPLAIDLMIGPEGLFGPAGTGGEAPAVTIDLPADAPFRFLNGGREAVFAAARLTGAADFAETLAFVFRNLRWDVEDDLSQLVGDIAARRLVSTGERFAGWQRQAAANLATNFAEYLSEEAGTLMPAREQARFSTEIQALAADLERLESRLSRL